ncbi:MAG: hypothetical protein AB1793_09770, partial [Candidatus Thermoplasmatota archaeon]
GEIPRVSSRQAALTAAERHLLDVHREEVAWLLYKACQRAVAEERSSRIHVHRSIARSMSLRLLDATDIGTRLRAAIALERDLGSTRNTERLWLGLSADPLLPKASPQALAILSLRLVPRDSTRIWLAVAAIHDAEPAKAVEILGRVVAGNLTDVDGYAAHSDRGFVYWLGGRPAQAFDAYNEAKRHISSSLIPSAYQLCLAIQMDRREDLDRLVREIDLLAADCTHQLEECVSNARSLRMLSEWVPDRQHEDFARTLAQLHPRTAGRIINAYVL